MATRKKSFAAQIDQAAQARQPEPATAQDDRAGASGQAAAVEFTKYTVPIRTDQRDAMQKLIARTTLDYDVELSRAALVRLGLEWVLQAAADDIEKLLGQLADLERRELEMNANRSYSVSAGLDHFLPGK